MKNSIKFLINKRREVAIHKETNDSANSILVRLKSNGQTISKADKRLCDEYAKNILGDLRFSPWLYVYTIFSGEFKYGWITQSYYRLKINPRIKNEYGIIFSRKTLARILFRNNCFPDIFYSINGLIFDTERNYFSKEDFKNQIFQRYNRVVFKEDRSGKGVGIHVFDKDSFDTSVLDSLGNGVFQKFILQHEVFNSFTSSSVATLRLTTAVNESGEVSLRSSYLRLGRHGDSHIQSKSNIRVPIDTETGCFSGEAFDNQWIKIDKHPDTDISFLGHKIPSFDIAKKIVLDLHLKAPFARCIGWDIAIGKEGQVYIMEANADNNDIKMAEISHGPCFSDFILK